MYQVTIKGRTLDELRIATNDFYKEMNGGNKTLPTTKNVGIEKNLEKYVEAVIEVVKENPEVLNSIPAAPLSNANVISHIGNPVPQGGLTHDTSNVDIELDKAGLPWDKRIHAASKTKVKARTWKRRKNIEDALYYEVSSELKANVARLANPPVVPAAPTSPVNVAPIAPTPTVAAPVLVQPAPGLVAVPVETPIANAVTVPITQTGSAQASLPMSLPSGHTLDTFKTNFPMVFASLINEKKITQEYVNTLKTYFNVTEIWEVSEEQKAVMFNEFVNNDIIQKVM